MSQETKPGELPSEAYGATADEATADEAEATATPEPFDVLPLPLEAANQEEEEEEEDPLHIGNLISLESLKYGTTTGRVVYRSGKLVRIMPQEVSDRAEEYPMLEGGTEFDPELGISEITVIERQASDYYVDFLGAREGDILEFFTVDGQEAMPSAEVEAILKDDANDAIKLKDGELLKFRGVGPKKPIAVIRVRSSLNAPPATATQGEKPEAPVDLAARSKRQTELLALLQSVLPDSAIEVLPEGLQSFPDSIQREDLFQDLLLALPEKKRKNQRRIRAIEREVDIAMSLKNKSLIRSEAGQVLGPAPHLIITILDAIKESKTALPAAIPIVQAARVLNLDIEDFDVFSNTDRSLNYNGLNVFPRVLDKVEIQSELNAKAYEEGTLPESVGRGFTAYMKDLLERDQITLKHIVPGQGRNWLADQDVLRTAPPEQAVQGMATKLPNRESCIGTVIPKICVSIAYLNLDVAERSIRVLKAQETKDNKTGVSMEIAASDPSKVVAYVILPPKAAMALRPPAQPYELQSTLYYSDLLNADDLPTLTATLNDVHTTELGSPLHSWTLTQESASFASVATWLKSAIRYVLHPADSLAPRTPAIMSLLDTIGLGTTDLAPPVAEVIWSWTLASQRIWRRSLDTLRQEIQVSLNAEPPRTYQSVTGADATLWPALQSATTLKELLDDIRRRNPSIAEAPTLIAASLLLEAQGDATPLVFAEIARLDARPEIEGLDPVTGADALAKSRAYALRIKAIKARALLALAGAAPTKNSCAHVDRLEAIRNITGDKQTRARLLREFIDEFEGKRHGDWMTCVICREDCICYHELMELDALSKPAQYSAIQKQILQQFGGEKDGSKILCKNCHQELQDIEYSDGPEFDDNGNMVSHGSVLTEEQKADIGDTSLKNLAATLLNTNTVEFSTEDQKYIGNALQQILNRGGIQAPAEIVRWIVSYVDRYATILTPNRDMYEAGVAAQKKKDPVRFRSLPTHAAFIDQLRVGALTALIAVAIQITTPPIVVISPLEDCSFSRGGYPIENTRDPKDDGALKFVSCVVSHIRNDKVAPWMNLPWAGEPKIETIKKLSLASGLGAMQNILGAGKVSVPFSQEIMQLLEKARTDVVAIRARTLLSLTDQLPPGFRPEPFPAKVTNPVIEVDPVPPIAKALEDQVSTAAFAEPVITALYQGAISVIGKLHRDAEVAVSAGIATGQKFAIDSTCCPVRFSDLQGSVGKGRLVQARNLLRGAVPSAVNAGTHLWQTFDTPVPEVVDPAVEDGVFFKLFLRFCYTGPTVGQAHEFTAAGLCRQCMFKQGPPLEPVDLMKKDSGAQKKAEELWEKAILQNGRDTLAAQEGPLKIEVTASSFKALSEAIRRRRTLVPGVPFQRAPWKQGLELLILELRKGRPGFQQIAERLTTVLTAIPEEAVAVDEVDRANKWEALMLYSNALRSDIATIIGPTTPKSNSKTDVARAKEATVAMTMFDTLTEDPFGESPRALQEYWCAKIEATGRTFGIIDVKGATWARISPKHDAIINSLLLKNSNWYAGSITEGMRPILRSLAEQLGPALRPWIHAVRPGTNAYWSLHEAQLILRTLVLQTWHDGLNTASWMYADIGNPSDRSIVSRYMSDYTRALMFHAKQQFVKYSKETIKHILQERAMEDRENIVRVFEEIEDEEERAAEIVKKRLKKGRWAMGVDIRTLDENLFDFETEQRHRMGIVEAPVDPILLEGAGGPAVEDYGLGGIFTYEEGSSYDFNQGEAGADY